MSLFEACQKANIDQIKSLIKQQCNIEQVDDQSRTALHYCYDHENIDCARILLDNDLVKKSILNIQDNEGYSALNLACLNGNIRMVKYLCEQGSNVNLVDNESHSLIHWITVCEHLDLFDILIQYHAPTHISDVYGAFPIHYASQLCGNNDSRKGLGILKKLIDCNVDVNCVDEQKRTPFIWAASGGAIDALRVLYKAGANPLHVDKDSLTALHCAATRGHASCSRMLVEIYDCPIEGEDINGCTALFYAISLKHSDVSQILLDLRANTNHQDNRGRTPSHCATLNGNIDCLKQLIKYNANIWIKNKRGDYPVHEAVNAISLSKVQHDTDEYLQLQTECCDIVRYIFKLYPKKVNIRNGENRTSLHLAASVGDIAMCKILIECGARVNSFIQTTAGNFITPYDLAHIRCQDACAEYLVLNHGGQRGNLLAHIYARRIQKFIRKYKIRKPSIADQRRKLFARTAQTNKKSLKVEIPISNSITKPIPSIKSTDYLLSQAKICLDNKIIEDRLTKLKVNSSKYLINTSKEENNVSQRRHLFAKSKTTMTSMNHNDEYNKLNSTDKVIIHTSNSIATSVKLYERHKLIAEELFKIKQARIHNDNIIINRSLYKILIENAFNPKNRHVSEIEKYLETLLKAYENELEAIRKRTKTKEKHLYPSMNETELDNTTGSSKTVESRSSKKKSAPKAPKDDADTTINNDGEKKRKSTKTAASTTETTERKSHKTNAEKENDEQIGSTSNDQEVPVKIKKKRAPKLAVADDDNNQSVTTEEPIKKKKSKAPKVSPIIDDEFQVIDGSAVDEIQPYVEAKPKVKKSKKSKAPISEARYDSFEDLQVTNLDDPYPQTTDILPDMSLENLPPLENDMSEFQQSILETYNNLSSKVNFFQYVGDDQWFVSHLPKSGRPEPKHRIRNMLPIINSKEERVTAKSIIMTRGKVLKRFNRGMNMLVRDPKNIFFGEYQQEYEFNPEEDEGDGVDTDDLHRYAQKLRELEDQDREVNPEFLILQDGKTTYGVHESDADGKVTLAKRKPIYDRTADQQPDEQIEKKKLLSRLRLPFGRNKDGKDTKSASTTPDNRTHRKSSRKSVSGDVPNDEQI
ncbi:unnamed protein product [Adineta steineri]|uniref:Uncharacterized protein n=2 Tax=Adineta steineri TaxID=433720 RepID=A0A819CJY1_9BILA|nr:unnamed protein product [Adineta steineri]